MEQHIHKIWKDADDKGERYFPHEYMYKMLLSGVLEQYYEIDPKNSWMLAAAQKNIPRPTVIVPMSGIQRCRPNPQPADRPAR